MTGNNSQTPAPMRLPRGIWVLGFVSLLMDISSEMVHSLLPMFLVGTLGASALTVGIIEGLAESTALVVKVFSGALSDYLGKRKALAVFGYALGALSKPVFAIATSTGMVVAATRASGARRAMPLWPTSRRPPCAVPHLACGSRWTQ
jgi:sugar phosphate permease